MMPTLSRENTTTFTAFSIIPWCPPWAEKTQQPLQLSQSFHDAHPEQRKHNNLYSFLNHSMMSTLSRENIICTAFSIIPWCPPWAEKTQQPLQLSQSFHDVRPEQRKHNNIYSFLNHSMMPALRRENTTIFTAFSIIPWCPPWAEKTWQPLQLSQSFHDVHPEQRKHNLYSFLNHSMMPALRRENTTIFTAFSIIRWCPPWAEKTQQYLQLSQSFNDAHPEQRKHNLYSFLNHSMMPTLSRENTTTFTAFSNIPWCPPWAEKTQQPLQLSQSFHDAHPEQRKHNNLYSFLKHSMMPTLSRENTTTFTAFSIIPWCPPWAEKTQQPLQLSQSFHDARPEQRKHNNLYSFLNHSMMPALSRENTTTFTAFSNIPWCPPWAEKTQQPLQLSQTFHDAHPEQRKHNNLYSFLKHSMMSTLSRENTTTFTAFSIIPWCPPWAEKTQQYLQLSQSFNDVRPEQRKHNNIYSFLNHSMMPALSRENTTIFTAFSIIPWCPPWGEKTQQHLQLSQSFHDAHPEQRKHNNRYSFLNHSMMPALSRENTTIFTAFSIIPWCPPWAEKTQQPLQLSQSFHDAHPEQRKHNNLYSFLKHSMMSTLSRENTTTVTDFSIIPWCPPWAEKTQQPLQLSQSFHDALPEQRKHNNLYSFLNHSMMPTLSRENTTTFTAFSNIPWCQPWAEKTQQPLQLSQSFHDANPEQRKHNNLYSFLNHSMMPTLSRENTTTFTAFTIIPWCPPWAEKTQQYLQLSQSFHDAHPEQRKHNNIYSFLNHSMMPTLSRENTTIFTAFSIIQWCPPWAEKTQQYLQLSQSFHDAHPEQRKHNNI